MKNIIYLVPAILVLISAVVKADEQQLVYPVDQYYAGLDSFDTAGSMRAIMSPSVEEFETPLGKVKAFDEKVNSLCTDVAVIKNIVSNGTDIAMAVSTPWYQKFGIWLGVGASIALYLIYSIIKSVFSKLGAFIKTMNQLVKMADEKKEE